MKKFSKFVSLIVLTACFSAGAARGADEAPNKLLKPGFKIILTTPDAESDLDSDGFYRMSTVLMEVNADSGVVFYGCFKPKEDEHDNLAPLPSEKCPTIGNAMAYVPLDDLLKHSTGVKHVLLTILKAATGIGIIATTNLSYAFIQPAAQTVNALWNPSPMDVIQRDHRLGEVLKDTLFLAAKTEGSEAIPSRIMPFRFEELQDSIKDLEVDCFKSEYKDMQKELKKHPNDPSIQKGLAALTMERNFHDWAQEAYKRGQKEKPAAADGGNGDDDGKDSGDSSSN